MTEKPDQDAPRAWGQKDPTHKSIAAKWHGEAWTWVIPVRLVREKEYQDEHFCPICGGDGHGCVTCQATGLMVDAFSYTNNELAILEVRAEKKDQRIAELEAFVDRIAQSGAYEHEPFFAALITHARELRRPDGPVDTRGDDVLSKDVGC